MRFKRIEINRCCGFFNDFDIGSKFDFNSTRVTKATGYLLWPLFLIGSFLLMLCGGCFSYFASSSLSLCFLILFLLFSLFFFLLLLLFFYRLCLRLLLSSSPSFYSSNLNYFGAYCPPSLNFSHLPPPPRTPLKWTRFSCAANKTK